MSESSISWTTYTHNLWQGCVEVNGDPACGPDAGCEGEGCYARTRSENPFWWPKKNGVSTMFKIWGNEEPRRFFGEPHYLEPLKWNEKAKAAGKPERVFCESMGDWAEGRADQRPYLEKYLYPIVEQTPWLIWLLLTKRPGIAATIVPERWKTNGWPKNAWPGVTAVTQAWWDRRLPALMKIPAHRHFVSVEPMWEPIDMRLIRPTGCRPKLMLQGSFFDVPSWVICGGQSGKLARPMHPDWARGLRDQCQRAGIPFHFKQFGKWFPFSDTDGIHTPPFGCYNVDTKANFLSGKAVAERIGRKLDGRTWDEVPTL